MCDDEDRGVGADVVRRAAADDGRTADDGTQKLKRSAEHNPQPAHTQRQDEAAATSAGP